LAENLHTQREIKSNLMCASLSKRLLLLGMNQAEMKVEWSSHALSEYGLFSPRLLIQSNPGQPFKTIDQCLSGGELSRLNLLLISYVHDDQVLLLDEVDTGVSGETGIMIKSLLQDLAQKTQILCISHIAQVAAGGSKHYIVRKHSNDTHTETVVANIENDERRHELARLMCGVVDDVTLSSVSVLFD